MDFASENFSSIKLSSSIVHWDSCRTFCDVYCFHSRFILCTEMQRVTSELGENSIKAVWHTSCILFIVFFFFADAVVVVVVFFFFFFGPLENLAKYKWFNRISSLSFFLFHYNLYVRWLIYEMTNRLSQFNIIYASTIVIVHGGSIKCTHKNILFTAMWATNGIKSARARNILTIA